MKLFSHNLVVNIELIYSRCIPGFKCGIILGTYVIERCCSFFTSNKSIFAEVKLSSFGPRVQKGVKMIGKKPPALVVIYE